MKKMLYRRPYLQISRAVYSAAAVLLLSGFFASHPARAEDEHQYKLEAVFLYNFLNYITWPGHNAPLAQATICVTGNDPLLPYLDYVRDNKVSEPKLTIRKLGSGESTAGCHILFDRNGSVTNHMSGTLVISDRDHFGEHTSMIALIPDGDRMSIDIDNSLLVSRGFQVSSRLLKLAEEVR